MASCSSRVLRLDAAAQLLFGEACEPAFHQIEPGGAGGREMEMEVRMTQQPTLAGRGFVGGVIVDDQMEREPGRGPGGQSSRGTGGTPPPGGCDETSPSRCQPWKWSAANSLVVPWRA